MLRKFLKSGLAMGAAWASMAAAAQVPFTLMLEPVPEAGLPGLHSFARAQWGPYWLLVGGRIDGLHSMFPSSAFPFSEQNHFFLVVDTITWTHWSSPLHWLPLKQRFALATTNQQFYQSDSVLYVIGGYGLDSLSGVKKTFPTLTAIHVPGLISEILSNGNQTAQYVRQISDTFLAVTGGRLEKLNNEYLLIGGQNFIGDYTKTNSGLFFQKYTNAICRFHILDDGTNLALTNVVCTVDTQYLHRRDLNSYGWIDGSGTEGIAAYGGVFQYMKDVPFLWPVYITKNDYVVDTTFAQRFNQYTCPVVALYDSLEATLYTIFFAGISLYVRDEATGLVVEDTLVPFSNDVTILKQTADGTTEEILLPWALPELGLANAEFFPNESLPRYSNGVFRLHALTEPVTLGFIYGGINSSAGNFGFTYAASTVYRLRLWPGMPLVASSITAAQPMWFYPNPASHTLYLQPDVVKDVELVEVYHISGLRVALIPWSPWQTSLSLADWPAGSYVICLKTPRGYLRQAVAVCR